ncbi:hypothetical protein [Ornithinimicrobium cerasi]|uniref:DUF4386 family protein n=1 Tax=Ornithinimicrobium cerasi TaxID=2248773 RepID=A0A285VI89_9MICO|nr:hypothetical protein [Ornithinimicrobium cerasi]SOC53760.1 hypothetical protein SAMN05421879_102118 [Ornithinimicrobium cerasi]
MSTRTARPADLPDATRTTPDPDVVRQARRTGAWAGPLWLLAGLGTFAPESPGPGADAPAIRTYVEATHDVLALNAVSSVVAVVALLALVPALANLADAHRPGGVAGRYVVGAGVLAAVQMIFFSAVYSVWVFLDPATLGDGALVSLYAAGGLADSFGSLTLIVTCSMVALVSLLALRHRFLSRPVAVLGLLVAAGELVSLAQLLGENSVSSTGMYVAIFGWFLWPAVVGLDLGLRLVRRRG